jgi:hypothetical protein
MKIFIQKNEKIFPHRDIIVFIILDTSRYMTIEDLIKGGTFERFTPTYNSFIPLIEATIY